MIRIAHMSIWMLLLHAGLQSAPLIQKVVNNSDFGLLVLEHSDSSSCSLQGKSVIIKPQETFNQEFLLELGQPSLTLRPVYYQDPVTKQIAWLTDTAYQYNSARVDQAFELWKKQKKIYKYKKTAQEWLHDWVGLDIAVVPHQVEMLGYLLNLSRVAIYNASHQHMQWLSFSKGIFSKLVLELRIQQHKKKGLWGKIHMLHGEGGICNNGVVERL